MQLNSSHSHTTASARTTDSVLYNSDQAALLREKLIQLREHQQAEKDTSEEQPYHNSSPTTASPADSQAERLKAIAADKIQRLKAMVTMMQQMAIFATGEEALAILRRLKMIVGELKQAVAMYAQAGGSGGGSANSAMPSAAPDTTAGANAGTPTPATAATPVQPSAANTTTEPPSATKESDSKTASPQQTGMQTEQTSQKDKDSQDDEFLNEVEKLKRLIKQVARAAEQALRRDQGPNSDLQQIHRDLKNIDKLSQEIASGQSPQGLAQSVQTIQAAYSASTTTGTVGNVQVNLAPPVVNTHT